jgi:hypothetical protein
MQSEFLANIIYVLHILFILWFIITPFTNNPEMLVLHLVTVPFIMFHWVIQRDDCCLTLVEMKLRGLDYNTESNKSFFYNLVSPFYIIRDENMRAYAWVVSICLWFITFLKVTKNPSMVTDIIKNARKTWEIAMQRSTEKKM